MENTVTHIVQMMDTHTIIAGCQTARWKLIIHMALVELMAVRRLGSTAMAYAI